MASTLQLAVLVVTIVLSLLPASGLSLIHQQTVMGTVPPPPGLPPRQELEQYIDAKPDIVYVDCFAEPEHSNAHVLDVQLAAVTSVMFSSPAEQQPPTCAQACWRAGYPYVGVKGYYQCWCGKEVKSRQFEKGRCMACLGSFQYRCGKMDSIAVYKVNQVPPHATVCQAERTVVIGATVTIQCLASGDEPIQFMWKLPAFNPRATASGGSLTISDVRPSDAGEYVCTAKNPYIGMPALRTSNTTARLTVQTPPIAHISVLREFKFGQAGTLLCEASGDRPLTLAWFIGNITVSLATLNTASLAVTYDRSAARTTLTVKNLTKESEGYYFCRASNNRIIDLSKRTFRAQYFFGPHGSKVGMDPEPTTADVEPSSEVPEMVVTTPVGKRTPASAGRSPEDLTAWNKTVSTVPMRGGFLGLGTDTLTVVAIMCGICAVLLLVLTLVVCYWQRRKVAELDEKRHTARLSTGHVLGSTGSYLQPGMMSDNDSTGASAVFAVTTLESNMAARRHSNDPEEKDRGGEISETDPERLHDMYIVDEDPEADFQATPLEPISTSYFETGALGPSAAGTYFSNPSVSLS